VSEEAEVNVIFNIFEEPASIIHIMDWLEPKDFTSEQHRLIYSAMVYQATVGDPISTVTIGDQLKSRRKLTAAGGASYLEQIRAYQGDVSDIIFYARLIKKSSISRDLVLVGSRLQEDKGGDPVERVNWGLERLMDLSKDATPSNAQAISDISCEVLKASLRRANGESTTEGVPTGFGRLDGVLLYLQPKSMYLIAARPSIGKSALATNIAVNAARRGRSVLFASLEMTKGQLVGRILSMESGVPYEKIISGSYNEEEKQNLIAADMSIRNLPIHIDDSSIQSVWDIKAKAMRMQVSDRLDLIIVDYLQLCAKDPSDFNSVSMVSNQLKAMAKILGVPVMGVSQVSREVEKREGDSRVRLSDLRMSGQLEQDADVVMGLNRFRHVHKLDVLKNRNGGLTGPEGIDYDFDNRTTKFFEKGIEVKQ